MFITESKYEPGKVTATEAQTKEAQTTTRKAVEDKKATALAELLSNQQNGQVTIRRVSTE